MKGEPPSRALQLAVFGVLVALVITATVNPTAGRIVAGVLVVFVLALALWPTDNGGPWGW